MITFNLPEQHQSRIIFSNLNSAVNEISNRSSAFIITEKKLITHYPKLKFSHLPTLILNISEHQKNISSLQLIFDFLIHHQISKQHTAFIIGGGVLHDVSMFACSVFKRGVPAISIPTTLLSMVDASIGGKNAINIHHYKNLIGTIYLPEKNIIVPEFLNTLPDIQLLSGWAEITKIALVTDKNFYNTCIRQVKENPVPPLPVIQQAIEKKLQIIQEDLHDHHQRQLLNFGHSIAHGIEAVLEEQNQYIPHGIAVATGMLIEANISVQLKLLSSANYQIISNDLQNIFPCIQLNSIHIPHILHKIKHDKKNTADEFYFTLITDIGKGITKIPVNPNLILNTLSIFFQ